MFGMMLRQILKNFILRIFRLGQGLPLINQAVMNIKLVTQLINLMSRTMRYISQQQHV